MRSRISTALTGLVLCAAASSCASRVETQLTFPPAADLASAPEPAFPVGALEPTPAGKALEDAWWNAILIWGRENHDKVMRNCRWSKDLGNKIDCP